MSELLIQSEVLGNIANAINSHFTPEIFEELVSSDGVFARTIVEKYRLYDGNSDPYYKLNEQKINRYAYKRDDYFDENNMCIWDSNDTEYEFWFDKVVKYNGEWLDRWIIRDENFDPRNQSNYLLTERLVNGVAFFPSEMPDAIVKMGEQIAVKEYQNGYNEGYQNAIDDGDAIDYEQVKSDVFKYYSVYYAQLKSTGTSSAMHEGNLGKKYYTVDELTFSDPLFSNYGINHFTEVTRVTADIGSLNPRPTWSFKNTNPYFYIDFFITISYTDDKGSTAYMREVISVSPNAPNGAEYSPERVFLTSPILTVDGYRLRKS